MKLKDRTIIVTGAGGGIGREIALMLGAEGANVVVNDYGGSSDGKAGSPDRADAVVAEIRSTGGTAVANADAVGSRAAAESIRDTAIAAFGTIDGLVNNAGIMIPGNIEDISDEQIQQTVEVNYLGVFRLIRAIWPTMLARGHGRIVNVSSNSMFGFAGLSAYGSSKAALIGLTADLAEEGKPSGIRVNTILPISYSRLTSGPDDGDGDSQAEKMAGWLKDNFPAADIAAIVAYLVSAECAVNGRHFTVGGGRFAAAEYFVGAGFHDRQLDFDKVARNIANERTSAGCFIDNASDELLCYAKYSDIPPPPTA